MRTINTKRFHTEQNKELLDIPRFSEPLKFALKNAEKAAVISREKEISPKSLFVGLLTDRESLAYFLLDKLNLDANETIKRLTGFAEDKVKEVKLNNYRRKAQLSKETKKIILDALRIAKEGKGYYIGTEHLLLALLRSGQKELGFLMELTGAVQSMPNFINEVLRATVTPFELLKQVDTIISSPQRPLPQIPGESSEPVLSIYTELMTQKFRKFPQSVEKTYRKTYSDQILSALLRQTYKNVLVVGSTGIGKSLLIEELAYRIVNGDVPISLRKIQIYRLNTAAIIALSKFPNEVDKQVLAIMNELYSQKDVILYIDDIHTLLNSPVRGGLNMTTAMKPFIENGHLTIIATISDEEYHSLVETNRAFLRFFNVVELSEPAEAESLKMLKDAVKEIELAHRVKISQEAIHTAIKLAGTYMNDRVLPEKAIEILDIAASKKGFQYGYKFRELGKLISEETELQEAKDRSVAVGDFAGAEVLRKSQTELQRGIKKLEKDSEQAIKSSLKMHVTAEDVRNIVAELTKLPISTISNNEMSSLLKLETNIKELIISQEDAIKRVVSAVKRGRIGISNKKRPWASLMFLGPTGVGKTELAKVLARLLFGNDEDRLIQIDMSEFMEQHSVSKLLGSPPGYIGYEQGGWLTEKLLENPHSVVLFDEIEKAHPEVLNILLQILEDGQVTDSRGNKVSFHNSLIILTSNIGAEKIAEDKVLGFYRDRKTAQSIEESDYEEMKEKLLKELKKKLRPELLNRLDDIIIFRSLTKDDASKVLEILLRDLNKRLDDLKLEVSPSTSAKQKLLEEGFSSEYGARPLRRVLQHEIEDLVADYVLEKNYLEKEHSSKDFTKLAVDFDKKAKKFLIAR